MDKHLKNRLSEYIKQVERKTFSDSEILKTEEIAVIYAYTEDMYEPLNERLRRNLGQLDTDFGKELDRILAKLPNFEGWVFKGASLNSRRIAYYETAFNNYENVIHHAFESTSKSELTAKAFMRNSKTDKQVLFAIISKSGKDVEKYSKYGSLTGQNEKEVLFRANAQFEVLNIATSSDFITITLNEI
jgi:NAD:arginine ADP-ribosyltransferase